MPRIDSSYRSIENRKEEARADSKNQEKRSDSKKQKEQQLQAKHQTGTREQLKQLSSTQLKQAIAQARAIGSPVVEIPFEGKTLQFSLTEAQAQANVATHPSSALQASATPPKPEEVPFFQNGEAPAPLHTQNLRAFIVSKFPASQASSGTGSGLDAFSENQFQLNQFSSNQLNESARTSKENIKKMDREMKKQMRLIMLLIAIGDVVGAMRMMLAQMESDSRKINRLTFAKLDKIRDLKSKVISIMAKTNPPRVTANMTPERSAKIQNDTAMYNKTVSFQEKTFQEIQGLERTLVELMNDVRRAISEMTEAFSALKETVKREASAILRS